MDSFGFGTAHRRAENASDGLDFIAVCWFLLCQRGSRSKKRTVVFFVLAARGVQNMAINSLTLAVFAQQRSNGAAPLRPKDVHFPRFAQGLCVYLRMQRVSLRSHSRARLINKLNTIQLPDIDVKCLFTSNHSAAAACCVCLPIKFNCAYAFIVPAEEDEDKNAGNFPTQAHCFVKVSAGGIVLTAPSFCCFVRVN